MKPQSRWRPRISLWLFVAAVWLLLNNSISPGNIVFGLFLGWLLPALVYDFLVPIPPVRQPFKLLKLFITVFYDIVVANVQVAIQVLGPRRNLHPAFVRMPIRIEDEFVLSVLTSIISLTPGTVSAELSKDRKSLLVHALDGTDLDGLVQEIQSRYEQPLLEIFPCSGT